MGTIGFGALLLALGVFFYLDGRSEHRFGPGDAVGAWWLGSTRG